MFVPVQVLVNEKPLVSTEDVIEALDNWVLPRYKNETTHNIAYTKTECFGVLMAFYQAGKLNPNLTPHEIEKSVEKFMDEKFFILPEQYEKAQVAYLYQPKTWFVYPLKDQFKDLMGLYVGVFSQFSKLVRLTGAILLTNIIRSVKYIRYRVK